MKPKIMLVELSQLPDLGINLSALGNKENNPNGRPRDIPKPNIPNVNWFAPASEVIDPAKRDPRIGPVQENETIARVNAMKKIPIVPFNLEEALSE